MGSHTAWYRVPHERARVRVRTRVGTHACVRVCARARGFVWVSQSPSRAAHVDYNRHSRWVSGGRHIHGAGHVPWAVRHHGAGLVRRAASPAREGGCSVTHIHFRHRCVTLVLVEESDEAIAVHGSRTRTAPHRTVASTIASTEAALELSRIQCILLTHAHARALVEIPGSATSRAEPTRARLLAPLPVQPPVARRARARC